MLWADQRLPLFPDQEFLYHQAYPPGVALWAYLWMMARGTFVHGDAFCAFGLYCVSLTLPLCARIDWRKAYWLPVVGLAALALPTAFHLQYDSIYSAYHALVGDAALGMTLGYALWLVLTPPEEARAERWIALGLALSMLSLIKPSGIGLALLVLLVATARALAARFLSPRGERTPLLRAGFPPRRLAAACAVLLPLLAYGGWQWTLAAHHIPATYRIALSPQALLDLLRGVDTSFRQPVWDGFTRALTTRLAVANPYDSFGVYPATHLRVFMVLGVAALWLAARLPHPRRRAQALWTLLGIAVAYALYAASLLMLYLFSEPQILYPHDAMPSFDRYMGSFYQALLWCLFAWGMRAAPRRDAPQSERFSARAAVAVALTLVLLWVPVARFYDSVAARRNDYMPRYYPVAQLNRSITDAEYIQARVPEGAAVGCLYITDDVRARNTQALLYPLRVPRWNTLPPMPADTALDGWHAVAALDYIFLSDLSEDFAEAYAPLFEGGARAVRADMLYRVQAREDAAWFVAVGD